MPMLDVSGTASSPRYRLSRDPEAREGGVKGASPPGRRTGERPPPPGDGGDDEDMLAVGPGEDPRGMGELGWPVLSFPAPSPPPHIFGEEK